LPVTWTHHVYRVGAGRTGVTNLTSEVQAGTTGGDHRLLPIDWLRRALS
jgi:hypothetical protein